MAIEIIDTLGQKNNGEFPLVDSNDIKGGFYQVDTVNERDLIPSVRRKEGMLCAVKNDKVYQLFGGIGNEYWVVFKAGSGGGFSGDYSDSFIHVGTDEPTADNCEVWIDVSDDEEFSSKIEDALVDEIRSIIGNLQGEIDKLKKIIVDHEARIEYLELNGGGSSGDSGEDDEDNDNSGGITTKFVPMVFEDGEVLVFEDDTILTFEDLNY